MYGARCQTGRIGDKRLLDRYPRAGAGDPEINLPENKMRIREDEMMNAVANLFGSWTTRTSKPAEPYAVAISPTVQTLSLLQKSQRLLLHDKLLMNFSHFLGNTCHSWMVFPNIP
jgi:hypothetical protein